MLKLVYTCKLSTWRVEAEGLGVQGNPQHGVFINLKIVHAPPSPIHPSPVIPTAGIFSLSSECCLFQGSLEWAPCSLSLKQEY